MPHAGHVGNPRKRLCSLPTEGALSRGIASPVCGGLGVSPPFSGAPGSPCAPVVVGMMYWHLPLFWLTFGSVICNSGYQVLVYSIGSVSQTVEV